MGVGEVRGVQRAAHQQRRGGKDGGLAGRWREGVQQVQRHRPRAGREVLQPDAVGADAVGEVDAGAALQLDLHRAEVAVVAGVRAANPEGLAALDVGVAEQRREDAGGVRRAQFTAGVAVKLRRALELGRRPQKGVEVGRDAGRRGETNEVQASGGPLVARRDGLAGDRPDVVHRVGVADEVGGVADEPRQRVGDHRRTVPDRPLAVGRGGLRRGLGELKCRDGRLPEPDLGDGVGGPDDEAVECNVRGVHVEEYGVPAGLERDGLRLPLGVGDRRGDMKQRQRGH